jgi:hypothetical protein
MSTTTLSPYRFYTPPLNESNVDGNADGEVIFGSLTVAANSVTPYTDATQVGKMVRTPKQDQLYWRVVFFN